MKQYKMLKVYYNSKLSDIEKVLNDMAKDGWELVCMTPEPSNLKLIITFCREEGEPDNTEKEN